MKKIKVLHLINSIEVGGSGNLLHSQMPFYNINKFDIYIGYLTGTKSLFNNFANIKLIDFSSNTKFSKVSFFKILRFVISKNINIIHTHLIQSSLIGRLIALIIPSVKCITTRHYAKSKNDKRIINRIEDLTEKYCDAVVCISKYVKNHLLQLGIDESKLHLIYNGIFLDIFNKYNLDNNKKIIIGTIGRLDKQKGIDILLNAFKNIQRINPKVKLEIIGDGPLKEEYFQLSKMLELEDNVIFYGKLDPEEVRQKMTK